MSNLLIIFIDKAEDIHEITFFSDICRTLILFWNWWKLKIADMHTTSAQVVERLPYKHQNFSVADHYHLIQLGSDRLLR